MKITLDTAPFDLVLADALTLHNRTMTLADPSYVALDTTQYLQEWLSRQLEGLVPAVAEVQEAAQRNDSKVQAARDRAALAIQRTMQPVSRGV